MTKREALARAVCKAEHAAPDPDSHVYIDMKAAKAWEARLPTVDALLRELREPDEGMCAAGVKQRDQIEDDLRDYVSGETTDWDTDSGVVAVWQAMIDHLMEPG